MEENEKRICDCGNELTECTYMPVTPMVFTPMISVDNGFFNNTVGNVKAYVCKKCKKIHFYADCEFKD